MPFPAELADDDYCYLTTTGRRSGQPREIEIWFAMDRGVLYLLAGAGEASHWVRNIRAKPDVSVRIRHATLAATGEVLAAGAEDLLARDLVFAKYQARYHGDLTDWRRTALPVALRVQ